MTFQRNLIIKSTMLSWLLWSKWKRPVERINGPVTYPKLILFRVASVAILIPSTRRQLSQTLTHESNYVVGGYFVWFVTRPKMNFFCAFLWKAVSSAQFWLTLLMKSSNREFAGLIYIFSRFWFGEFVECFLQRDDTLICVLMTQVLEALLSTSAASFMETIDRWTCGSNLSLLASLLRRIRVTTSA